ncbi:MAG: AtpZ/AtpI family protein [Lachnospiraceae bacterium]|nr:AtpZ/AtpI family protein [Lachnospiraceae bacterium]
MSQRKEVIRSFMLISHLGVTVMVPIFLCVIVGIVIDKHFGTSTLIWLLFLGIAAGLRNAYILLKGVLDENVKERENAERLKRERRLNANKKQED